MSKTILKLVKEATMADAQIVGNMAMVALVNPDAPESSDVVSLRSAIRNNVAEVHETEVVENLRVSSAEPVLVRAGQGVLMGGKQDRIFRKGTIVESEHAQTLNVYCIQHGRWAYSNKQWIPQDIPLLIRRAALKNIGQGQVWDMIQRYLSTWGVTSKSNALGAVLYALGKEFEKPS